MIDQRFYLVDTPLSAALLAARCGGVQRQGDPEVTVATVASAAEAGPDDLTFLDDDARTIPASFRAGVCIAGPASAELIPPGVAVIEAASPRAAFARASVALVRVRELSAGQSYIHASARIAEGCVLEPGVIVGEGAAIGRNVRVGANAVIGPGVQIGAESQIGRHVSLRCALVGDGVIVQSGAIIGETGFGLAAEPGGAILSPHFGRVIIQNGSSIGANSCVDRGLFDDTVLGERVHVDNLCHIGHNVRIGSRSIMAAFAGVSGSSVVGDGAEFGGRVGLKDHVVVGRGARIAAGSAVLGDVPAGETWAGYPAKQIRPWMRELAWLASAAQKRPKRDD